MNDENIKKIIIAVLSNLREQIPDWRRSNSVYTDEDEEAIVLFLDFIKKEVDYE